MIRDGFFFFKFTRCARVLLKKLYIIFIFNNTQCPLNSLIYVFPETVKKSKISLCERLFTH